MRPIDEILADMRALLDGAAGRDFNDDELESWDKLEAELSAAQAVALRTAPAGGEGEGDGSGDEGDGTTASAPLTPAARAQRSAVVRTRMQAYNTVLVPAGVGRPSNRRRDDDPERAGWLNYLRTGRPNADMQPSNAQTTGTGSSGGFTVPEEFRTKITEVIKSFGGVFNDAEQLRTENGRPMPWPTNNDTGNEGVVAAENTAPGSGADLVFGEVQLGAFEYAASGAGGGALKVPIALVQDSAVDIEAYIAKKLGERIARKMARDAVTGTGTGQAQGILQGITGLEMAGSTLEYADLVDLIMSLDPAYWAGAKWYFNAASFGTIVKLEDGADQLIFKPGVAMLGDTNGTQVSGALQVGPVLAPVVIDNAFGDIVGSNGDDDNWGVFGNLTEGYVWRTVRDIEVLVNPYTSANARQIEYNAFVRADGRQQNTAAYKVAAGHTT